MIKIILLESHRKAMNFEISQATADNQYDFTIRYKMILQDDYKVVGVLDHQDFHRVVMHSIAGSGLWLGAGVSLIRL